MRLYSDLAWLWPVLSPPEDYAEEVEQAVRLIEAHMQIPVHTLLDLGCGGGHNDRWLKQHFRVTGVDLSPAMLDLARQLNPDCTYHAGDMRSVRLDETFDAVFIADSIDYMLSDTDLLQAFTTAYTHLNPGGIFFTYAEEYRERFVQNATTSDTNARGDLEVTLIDNTYDPDGQDTTYEYTLIYLIRSAGKLQVELDHHILGLFSLATWEALLQQAGFKILQQQTGDQGIIHFICLKPSQAN